MTTMQPGAVPLLVEKVLPGPDQPRKYFADAEMEELCESIRENGLLQAILVKPTSTHAQDGTYHIIEGERRYRAMKCLGRMEIPAVVFPADTDSLVTAIVVNINRENLNPIEEANAIVRLQKERRMSLEAIARKFGKSRDFIDQRIAILKLPPDIQKLIATRELALNAGLLLLRKAKNAEEMRTVLKHIGEKLAREIEEGAATSTHITAAAIEAHFRAAEKAAQRLPVQKGKGMVAECTVRILPAATYLLSLLDHFIGKDPETAEDARQEEFQRLWGQMRPDDQALLIAVFQRMTKSTRQLAEFVLAQERDHDTASS